MIPRQDGVELGVEGHAVPSSLVDHEQIPARGLWELHILFEVVPLEQNRLLGN